MSHVVVIGGGIVGLASVIELQRDGHQVTLIEPGEPGGEQSASYGNGTLLNPSSVIPMSSPGIWKKVPGYLRDPLGPLTIRWSYLPRLLPWLRRFIAAGATEAKVAATARALQPLLADAPALHLALAEEAGVAELMVRQGVLFPFPDRAAFEAEGLSWRIRRQCGTRWLELNEDELRQREPNLARRYRFALLVEENGQCRDPGAYVAALGRLAMAQGATLRQARATGFRIDSGRLRAVTLDSGEVACDKAVIAAGAWSKQLAAAAGDRVVLETERGYHVVISDPGIQLRYPMMPSDGKMACVMTPLGLRLAGQVELAGLDAAPNWNRAQVLLASALSIFPDLPKDLPADRVRMWMGHRPSTPDGLPVLGPASGCADVIHAFGHGHVGLTAGAKSGKIVADLVAGRPPGLDMAPYAARRFA
ncbi:NAD(P)/FAD-dependent oxidoreductase [Rhodopila sp.]|jgi:D-amino-acid dehydrogenase|uniref:NAD(P)/FAD-dependent oxidoreductase n=1 Tax=Rhodopila sp. TaxID=2480087 RepID=UPI002BBAB3F2|nr:FAD-dependent oxidoreductase [Rhodopila sp.]HVZ07592.1 FAD-dependent oxidoreductase [Rhodopila sp.]